MDGSDGQALRRPRVRRFALLALLVLATGLVGVAQSATPASALCITPKESGKWANIDPASRSIVKAENSLASCGDVISCPVGGQCSGGKSVLNIHLWGACSPTPCDWGVRKGPSQTDGWWMATWVQSYATRYLWVRAEQHNGLTYLRVAVNTDFTAADGRADYWSNDWMLKA